MTSPRETATTALWDAMAAATSRLESAGVPSPRYDAEALAAAALGITRSRLRVVTTIDDDDLAAYDAMVARRATREPLQHIVGTAAFRHVEVAVGPGVFVPRPETEVVAGWAIDRAREVAESGRRPVVVDLCTGSGAIALSVADEVPHAQVHAVEVSPEALAWATRNLVDHPVALVAADAGSVADPGGVLAPLAGTVDVVVANPPYVPAGADIRDPEVLAHDPPLALWGHGPDGLQVMRAVVRTAGLLLRDGGYLVVEHSDLQGQAVPALIGESAGWADVADHRDLAGRDRFATARRDRRVTP
jgi:release factor glutamine methyltransferase